MSRLNEDVQRIFCGAALVIVTSDRESDSSRAPVSVFTS